MRVVFKGDITIQMGTDYGGIRMRIDFGNDTETRYLISPLCNWHNLAKGGVKVHLERKRNELLKRYDLQCLSPRGNIQRHRITKSPPIYI